MFPLKSVGDFYNKYFINVHLNCDDKSLKPVLEKYGVKGYPTFIFVNKDKTYKSIMPFGVDAPGPIIRLGKKMKGLEYKSYEWYVKQYNNGNRDTEFLKMFLSVRFTDKMILPDAKIIYDLITSYPKSQRFSEENQKRIIGFSKWGNDVMALMIDNMDKMTLLQTHKYRDQFVRRQLKYAENSQYSKQIKKFLNKYFNKNN